MKVPAIDFELTAKQLDDKYNPEGDGEHPHRNLTRAEWREAVYSGHTISGYWQWIANELTENPENYPSTKELTLTRLLDMMPFVYLMSSGEIVNKFREDTNLRDQVERLLTTLNNHFLPTEDTP